MSSALLVGISPFVVAFACGAEVVQVALDVRLAGQRGLLGGDVVRNPVRRLLRTVHRPLRLLAELGGVGDVAGGIGLGRLAVELVRLVEEAGRPTAMEGSLLSGDLGLGLCRRPGPLQ